MPALHHPSSSKILVTGINGFIAIWVAKTLLDRGYVVRGTSRSESKNEHLEAMFKSYVEVGKLELTVVDNIDKVCDCLHPYDWKKPDWVFPTAWCFRSSG